MDNELDDKLSAYFNKTVPSNNAAFDDALLLFLYCNKLPEQTSFLDLPPESQSVVAHNAAMQFAHGRIDA